MITGHEPASNTISWTLLEFAKRPEIQHRLRAEIRQMEAKIRARGDHEFTADDMESMPYLVAITKVSVLASSVSLSNLHSQETLRCNPASYYMIREAGKNDVLPLSKPVTTRTGEVVNEVPVPKGMKIMLSIAAYNRQGSSLQNNLARC